MARGRVVGVDVDAVIFELYGLRPADFTAVRDAHAARARREKDTAAAAAIGALRRPTLAVWAANLLARAHPDQAEALLRLGAELRRAYRELDGAQLRALSHEQHRVIAALAAETGQLAADAGEQLRETVVREVEGIFHGLLADEVTARQWAAGCLRKAPTAAVGFEGLEPAPGAVPRRTADAPAPPAVDRDATAAAREQAAAASAALRQAEEHLTEASLARDRAEADAAGLRGELAALQERLGTAQRAAQEAEHLHRQAEQARAEAERTAEKAGRRLAELDRSEG
ncbi:hypothetical protein [Streptomyces avidinii]|uniref:Transposase n=1 Tax=Streptomyces avidinii TaxID=1895 RepID=A0ABS4L026_STRAV|nr:hypothetical protein [Streptomyces avidinii]MBP2034464.1 hypothetical protein [Streptomyces avidinii]GGY86441.1 hypothetical protein GCM10010343_09280 [Streptomyces avidinii]